MSDNIMTKYNILFTQNYIYTYYCYTHLLHFTLYLTLCTIKHGIMQPNSEACTDFEFKHLLCQATNHQMQLYPCRAALSQQPPTYSSQIPMH